MSFFLGTRIVGVIPPKYEAGLQQKSTFFDDGGRGDCLRSVGFFGFFLLDRLRSLIPFTARIDSALVKG